MQKTLCAAYTSTSPLPDAHSLHLALRGEDGAFEPLNYGIGVLFAEADFSSGKPAGETIVLDAPVLTRLDSGKIAVTALLSTADGEPRGAASWETADLVRFTRLPEPLAHSAPPETAEIGGESVAVSLLALTAEEADYLRRKLGEVKNVSADPIAVSIAAGEALRLPPLTARYSDGSAEEIPVEWDAASLAAVDACRPGEYAVTGRAVVKEDRTPILWGIADPMVLRYEDFFNFYFLVGTNEHTGGRDLWIRHSDTIEGLTGAQGVCIFRATESGDHSGCNWAPELHVIGGKLCCLFASSTNGEWDHVQSRIMVCEHNPTVPEQWSEPVRVTRADGSPLIEDGITLDMTYFEANGRSYYCWAQRTIDARGMDSSDLMIAPVDPAHPERLAGEPVLLCRPKYAWDRQHTEVDEGPNVLKHGGKLFMTFSGDSVSDYYCLGLLTADENADLLDPASWEETGYPVLAREHTVSERGPGHNSFTKDEYGRDVIIYHAKPDGGMRSFFARTIHYGFDGTPLLTLTPERYLLPELRTVTAKVTVR